MRTLFHAAFLATTIISTLGVTSPSVAADLDHYYYEPRPRAELPPPPPPCGVYRPCLRPRFGYVVPRYRFGYPGPRFRYGYVEPGYGPRPNPRYGEDRYGYNGRPPDDRYGFDRPGIRPYEAPRYGRLDHYGDDERRREFERYDRGPRGDFRGRDPDDRG